MPPKRKAAESGSGSTIFADVVFAVSGTLSTTQAAFSKLVGENGGSVATSVTKAVTHLVTTEEDLSSGSTKTKKAKDNGIFIVSEAFVNDSIAAGKKLDESSFVIKGGDSKKAEKAEKEDAEETTTTTRKSSRASKKKEEKEESEEEEEAPPPPAKKGRKAAAPKKVEKEESEEEEEEEEEEEKGGRKEKVVVKGSAAVDKLSGHANDAHVLEEGGVIYDAMLNQTNIANNNNKFYVVQILEKDGGGKYWVWNRWGRVGENGANKLFDMGGNKAKAIADFRKKYKDKTKNDWDNRNNFKPVAGKYTQIEIDYGKSAEAKKPAKAKTSTEKKPVADSKLDDRVQNLIKLIFDLKMMETAMAEMEFDVEKSPLGNLGKKTVKQGYEVLKQIEQAINSKAGNARLTELSSQFYTLIPHSFGRTKPPVIQNSEVLKKKMQMLEALADIEIATTLLKESENSNQNQIDANYNLLNCDIEAVDEGSEDWKEVQQYIKNTHENHTPKIKGLYKINRKGEKERFNSSVHLGNRKLLWHGSRLTNYVGIISQGLRIAPPEAPVSGYRFGKGIYFADIASLSSIYCRSQGSNDFCMLLADVALGKEKELPIDTYMEKAPAGFHSTKALGTIEPDTSKYKEHKDGYTIPYGPIVNSGHKQVSCKEHQYIVYDVAQANLKYLIHLNW